MCELNVMTFNLRGSVVPDGENTWPKRAELNVRTIRQCDPDVIGFQEYQFGNQETYDALLGDYDYFRGAEYNDAEPFCYPAIYWRREKFTALDTGKFWLSLTPEKHSRAWNTACVRSANWVKLKCRKCGIVFTHLNTHLDHISELARVSGSELILRKIGEAGLRGPLIITGDFNCNPGSAAYRLFIEAGFSDTYLAAGNVDDAEAYTFHEFKGVRHPECVRIDWILTLGGSDGLKPITTRIVRDKESPLYPSDHYPVITKLEVGDAA